MIGYRISTSRGVLWTTNPHFYEGEGEPVECEVIRIPDLRPGMTGFLSVGGDKTYTVQSTPEPVNQISDGRLSSTEQYAFRLQDKAGKEYNVVARRLEYLTVLTQKDDE